MQPIPDVTVGDCRAEDVADLEAALPAGRAHETQHARAAAGLIDYLVAKVANGDPVGTAVIHWDGYHDGDVADQLGPIPEIATVHVAERARSRGVGTALIAEAECRIAGRGHPRVCLGVGLDNARAQALYERLGYTDTGLRSTVTYTWTDAVGADQVATETDRAMVKSLSTHPAALERSQVTRPG
ncbi:GNAT family N-acetyltransferase [Occultella gossypii]|uniref:GNAT family N-acetyltransferase n=1 Tax=Occultella gossypii TaxID=2800820 RepID=A0ABS7SDU1_9MICO|nr:GNAT family N-acetyltransferase [Occultella gossypii]MBZ2198320.1 GNAT family N-acetyltransferase [Occultella gossypii]